MKTLCLGFDGASPILIHKWIDNLPTFRRFKEEGIFGLTIPPIPAQTPVAWTTFMTGKNPGNHEVFSFAFRETGTYERRIIDPKMLKSRTLWHILSDAGKRVGVSNVPMCDIEDLNGFIIPGFMSRSEGVPHPRSLKEKIKKKFGVDRLVGDLDISTLERVQSDPELFFKHVNEITDRMADICLYLLQEEKWDFFMPVFMGMDRIHHFFWQYVDSAHPKHEENVFTRLVKEFYIKADSIVGRFLRFVDEDTFIMVLSDHGFCPVYKEVFVNNYLEENGFLVTDSGKIDLEESRAISYGYGDVWLNVKGREPKGLINTEDYNGLRTEISNELKKIEIDGKKPIKDVKRREELWWGVHVDKAPDLNIIFNVGYQAARHPEIIGKNKLKRYANDNPRWTGGHDGTHDPIDVPGVIGILGPKIEAGKEIRTYLWDIAPTILGWMKVAVPPDMDGKALQLLS